MKGRLSILIAFALLMTASALFAQTSGSRLVIEVTDAAGQPLRNACVTVIPKEGEITFRKADKNGRVSLRGISPGSYRVVAKVDGFVAQKRVVAIAEGALETVAFALQPRGAVEE